MGFTVDPATGKVLITDDDGKVIREVEDEEELKKILAENHPDNKPKINFNTSDIMGR